MPGTSVCPIECLKIKGPSTARAKTSVEYEIYMEFPDSDCAFPPYALTVFLSYGGSNMIPGVDFIGPDKVYMKFTVTTIKFSVTFLKPCTSLEDKYIEISMYADRTDNICSAPLRTTISCAEWKDPGDPDYETEIPPTYCGELFFFDPYNHQTKIPNNMK